MTDYGQYLVDRVDKAVGLVKFKLVEGYSQGAARFYIISIVAALDKLNESSKVHEPEQCRELITKLMKKVKPPAVRQVLFKAKTLWTKQERSNLKLLAEQLSEYSAQVQRVHNAISETVKRNNGKGKKKNYEMITEIDQMWNSPETMNLMLASRVLTKRGNRPDLQNGDTIVSTRIIMRSTSSATVKPPSRKEPKNYYRSFG